MNVFRVLFSIDANLKTIMNKLINPYFKIRMKIALMNKNPEKQIANP